MKDAYYESLGFYPCTHDVADGCCDGLPFGPFYWKMVDPEVWEFSEYRGAPALFRIFPFPVQHKPGGPKLRSWCASSDLRRDLICLEDSLPALRSRIAPTIDSIHQALREAR